MNLYTESERHVVEISRFFGKEMIVMNDNYEEGKALVHFYLEENRTMIFRKSSLLSIEEFKKRKKKMYNYVRFFAKTIQEIAQKPLEKQALIRMFFHLNLKYHEKYNVPFVEEYYRYENYKIGYHNKYFTEALRDFYRCVDFSFDNHIEVDFSEEKIEFMKNIINELLVISPYLEWHVFTDLEIELLKEEKHQSFVKKYCYKIEDF